MPSGVRVWLAVGRTDMRRGMNGLALQVQEALGRDPHAGDFSVFRGGRGDLIKILWLADVLARIAEHPAHRLDDLLPWNWRQQSADASRAA